MAHDLRSQPGPPPITPDKGLKRGALGLVSSVVIGVASTAPAYSLAATLGFIVTGVGLQSPAIVVLAFVPMLFTAIGYSELNKADPDCGTTFTWATRAFGPTTGWLGGWGILAADLLVMSSLAQVAGQYVFLLFDANDIGHDPTSNWVLLVGIAWIVLMTCICYVGIELSARLQRVLLAVELIVLLTFAVVALVRVGIGHAPTGAIGVSWSWLNPFRIDSFSAFFRGLLLMIFIYWGWDSAVSVNEETADPSRTPGRAAVLSTLLLVVTYALVTVAAQSFAGIGTSGIGLGNQDNAGDVLSVLGSAVFGPGWVGSFLSHLLVLMVLTSAAASTQTTILPTARTSLAMATYRALPRVFAKMHPRHLTPSVSTLTFGAVSIVLYAILNNVANPTSVIADCVTALGMMIAFYYGLTGFACTWYYRRTLRQSARNLWMRGILPTAGGLILYFALAWSLHDDWLDPNVSGAASYTVWHLPFSPHWNIGGVFLLGAGTVALGIGLMILQRLTQPPYFRGDTLAVSAAPAVGVTASQAPADESPDGESA
ncbi:Amino acid transporter [Nakamurella panacisegetis]|uniref:Amino acid transporter n=1 Tax=Nakamurella panacisegetis TaxID=1090615 RepID=A0A1H0I2F7_9ACTN|nr:APC family permease [Nakamurella panacisegetis]SDO25320.1 Amino acid transporter [Nakamurella panacisegetis]